MIDHYYGAYGNMGREWSMPVSVTDEKAYGRRLEGEELAAAAESLRRTAKTESSAVVTLAPPQPPPPPRPTEQIFEPLPGVMVREDIPAIPGSPEIEMRRSMVEAKVNDQPDNPPGGLYDLLDLGAKRDISLSENLALLGAYDGDVQNLTLRSRVEMGDVHGAQLFTQEGLVHRSFTPQRTHRSPEMSFSLQTVDGGIIDIQLSIEEFVNREANSDLTFSVSQKAMSRTLTFTMDSQGPVSQAAWEGLAPIMEKLDGMINTFNTDQALRQSDVDAFASQMAEQQDLYNSSELQFHTGVHVRSERNISITTHAGQAPTISVDENEMDTFYNGAAFRGSLAMGSVSQDAGAVARFYNQNPEGFYLPAVSEGWSTDYDTFARFVHSLLEP